MTMLNDFLSTSATWGVLLTLAAFALVPSSTTKRVKPF